MSTNYYLIEQANRCEQCGRFDEANSLHVGKSSGGWAFALRVHPAVGISSLDDWKEHWKQPDTFIVDSYGKKLNPEEMLDVILNRSGNSEADRKPMNYSDWAEFHKANYSYRGPRNLLFSTYNVVASEDTYQLFEHEFS